MGHWGPPESCVYSAVPRHRPSSLVPPPGRSDPPGAWRQEPLLAHRASPAPKPGSYAVPCA
eukprot:8936700-Alexandrium_andersonii.AAC.1